MSSFDDTRWHEWTPCEFHGHKFQDGSCVDCGEQDCEREGGTDDH